MNLWNVLRGKEELISVHWEIAIYLFCATGLANVMRVNMSVAAIPMSEDLGWLESERGLVLSAFFWGYAVSQMPAIMLAEKYGAKATLTAAVLGSSLLTLFIPAVSKVSLSLTILFRALVGVAQAGVYPSVFWIFPRWLPVAERTVIIAFIISGAYFGQVIGFAVSGALVSSPSYYIGTLQVGLWDSVFYAAGAIGIVWLPFFWYHVTDAPTEDPRVDAKELAIITQNNDFYEDEGSVDTKSEARSRRSSSSAVGDRAHHHAHIFHPHKVELDSIPWCTIMKHPVVIVQMVNSFVSGWIGFMVVTQLPSYLYYQLHFDIKKSGVLSMLPYIANFVSVEGFSWVFNQAIVMGVMDKCQVRQWANRIAFLGASGCMVILVQLEDTTVVMALLVLTLGFFGAVQSGIACTYLDISPSYSSEINTIGNMVSAIAGILGPIILAELIAAFDGATGWKITFYITLGLSVFSLVLWKIYMKAELIPELNASKSEVETEFEEEPVSPVSPGPGVELVRNHKGSDAAEEKSRSVDAIDPEPLGELDDEESGAAKQVQIALADGSNI